jgi:hypothetical protein
VALADEEDVPVVIVAPEQDRIGLPYVYRIASLATHRADFLDVGGGGRRPPDRLSAGTVVIGKRESLAAVGVSPLVEIAEFGIARIGLNYDTGEKDAAAHLVP